MNIEKDDPNNYNRMSMVKGQIEKHMDKRTTIELLNSVTSMVMRMGNELLETSYRFNEYRRLNAFSDINQKLEVNLQRMTDHKKQLLNKIENIQISNSIQNKIIFDDQRKLKQNFQELDRLVRDFESFQQAEENAKIEDFALKEEMGHEIDLLRLHT